MCQDFEKGYDVFRVLWLYIPPNMCNDFSIYKKHVDAIGYVRSRSNASDEVLVFGDFNMAKLEWSDIGHRDFLL